MSEKIIIESPILKDLIDESNVTFEEKVNLMRKAIERIAKGKPIKPNKEILKALIESI